MNNNSTTTHRGPCSGNVARGRKRKAVEDGDHETVARSNSGGAAVHQLRGSSAFNNHESRIVRVSRSSGGKDRHSKVLTAKGLRDRRVRLSVSTAIQFYDLQDRLRLDQPSKAVEWLLKAASHAIAELPVLDHPFHGAFSNAPPYLPHNTDGNTVTITKVGDDAAGAINVFAESPSALGMSSNNDSQSSKEGYQGQCELIQSQQKQQQAETAFGKGKMTSSKSSIEEDVHEGEEDRTQDGYYSALSLSRPESPSRVKARERSKRRSARDGFQFQIPVTAGADPAVRNQERDNDGTRDSFTGLLNSVTHSHAALESRGTDHNTIDIPQRRRTASLTMNISHHDLSQSQTRALSTPPSFEPLFHEPSQAQHVLQASSLMQQQAYGSQSFTFPTFVNAAIFGPLSLQRNDVSKPSGIFCTSQDQMHHLGGNTAHFTSIPSMQQQNQHSSFVDQEEEHVVPIISHDHMNMMSFSMPGLSGRETLQSNSQNTLAYHLTQRIQEASMFTSTRNVHMQGGFDNRALQRSMKDLESESSGSPAFKGNTKRENHYK